MHYVNCYMCEAYYKQDGNPFYVADDGQLACESCGSDQLVSEKKIQGSNIIYTLTAVDFSEMLDSVTYEIECDLKRYDVPFEIEMPDCESSIFTISKERATLHMLSGVDVDDLIYQNIKEL